MHAWRSVVLATAATAILVGCGRDDAPDADALAPSPEQFVEETRDVSAALGAGAAIGSFGVDLSLMDPDVRPGDDFYRYVNGRWLSSFDIPADRTNYGVLTALDEQAEAQVRVIVESAASGAAAEDGTPMHKVGALFSAWMDTARAETLGLIPVRAELERIAAAANPADIARLMGDPALGLPAIAGVYVDVDARNPDRYAVYLTQSGLGLPNRDYYLMEGERFQAIRSAYVAHIETILTMGGVSGAAGKAEAIMALETQMAQAHWPSAKRRDRSLTYNPVTAEELDSYAAGFPWASMLEALGLQGRTDFVLAENDAIAGMAGLFARTPVETWRDYLSFHLLNDSAPYLTSAFDEARFDFYGRTLNGQPEQRERWRRGVELVDGALGEIVGQIYVERHFSPQAKAQMQELVSNLRAAFREALDDGVEWMGEETKQEARAKLAAFTPKIGYPDTWETYEGLDIRADDLIGNIRRINAWAWRDQAAKLDGPVDRGEWFMTPQTVNAYYNPEMNEIVFPAAILQPPVFDPHADPAVNYGAIGAVIGHEMGHGFDDQGRKSDGAGMLRDWWTAEDAARFDERAAALGAQFAQYEPVPGHRVNPQFTMGENLGDLGGLSIAYRAYRLSLNGQEAPVIDGLTGDQRFFMAWAQIWRWRFREEELINRLTTDPHSPPEFRVNGVVRNMDAWYEAFDVMEGEALWMPSEERVTVW